jgi:hypothetical protein
MNRLDPLWPCGWSSDKPRASLSSRKIPAVAIAQHQMKNPSKEGLVGNLAVTCSKHAYDHDGIVALLPSGVDLLPHPSLLPRVYVRPVRCVKQNKCSRVMPLRGSCRNLANPRLHFCRNGGILPTTFASGTIMPSLNLQALPLEQLLPLPEVPEHYGPRDEEDVQVYEMVQEALAGPSKKYDTVADFMRALDAHVPA